MSQERLSYWLARHWMWVFSVAWGVVIGLPFVAPVFMEIGWTAPGRAIYTLYSLLCHQLPQRSFFLFGPRLMLPLTDIQAAFQLTDNPLILRQFVGNGEVGWKVAWSDRMVIMYSTILPLAWIWYAFRRQLTGLSVAGLFLLLIPMGLDGATHFVSDFAGVGQGFRDSNLWFAQLTDNRFPTWFYAGDALGSLNSVLRIGTGVLFAVGTVWFIFPTMDQMFLSIRQGCEIRFAQLKQLTLEAEEILSRPER